MSNEPPASTLDRLETGIPELDLIAHGGLPRGRSTLITGPAGSGKTVLAGHLLAAGIERGEPGVFVTFEETPAEIKANFSAFGWPMTQWEEDGTWRFVDASPRPDLEVVVAGGFDLSAFLSRIRHAVEGSGAQRLALDSLGALLGEIRDPTLVRRALLQLKMMLRDIGVTSFLTGERAEGDNVLVGQDIEAFVADNVMLLDYPHGGLSRGRTVELLKVRGASHQRGRVPFAIRAGRGIVIVPMAALQLDQASSGERISSGVPDLDVMCGGGFFRGSGVLLSGSTGTGKTLMALRFLAAGAACGERGLYLGFEESPEQLRRHAAGWRIDLAEHERTGAITLACAYPESASIEQHLVTIKERSAEEGIQRVVVDSLTALERVSSEQSFREFVVAISCYLKAAGATAVFTTTTPGLFGIDAFAERHISTVADAIIVMRYAEVFGTMRRGLAVVKLRGSDHDKAVREVTITADGMQIGAPFRAISGVLRGARVDVTPGEMDRIGERYDHEQAVAVEESTSDARTDGATQRRPGSEDRDGTLT